MNRTWGGILWLLVFVSLLVFWRTGKPSATSEVGKLPEVRLEVEVDGELRPGKLVERKVAPFSFTERSGREVTNETLSGRPWVVNFIFTSCVATCPANTTAIMNLAQQSKQTDARFVTITVDPERDTPERLQSYAEIYGADPEQWLFLTGEKQKIHDLIEKNFLQQVGERTGDNRLLGYEFAHSDRAMHIGPDGTILGAYLTTDPASMVKLRRVLAGETETPDENRFFVVEAIPKGEEEASAADQTEPTGGDSTAPSEASEQQVAAVDVPAWVLTLPTVNALLNSLATLLLMIGFLLIKQGKRDAHRNCMIAAFLVSIVFLACYLTYHFALHYYTGESSKKFPDLGFIRQVYLVVLISHIILAVAVPVLALGTLYHAWKQNWERHKTWARVTFPIWLYVSVTGVVIYVMLYLVAA